jgi:hypothetical protein
MLLDLNAELKGGPWTNNRRARIHPHAYWEYRPIYREVGMRTGELREFAAGVAFPLAEEEITREVAEQLRTRDLVTAKRLKEQLGPAEKKLVKRCPLGDDEPLLILEEREGQPINLRQLYDLERQRIEEALVTSAEVVDQLLFAYAIRRAGDGDTDAADRIVGCYGRGRRNLALRLSNEPLAVNAGVSADDLLNAGFILTRKALTGDNGDDVVRVMHHVMADIDSRPRAYGEALKKAIRYVLNGLLGHDDKEQQKRSRGYYAKITKDPGLWLSTLNHRWIIPELWTRCAIRRRLVDLALALMWQALPEAERTKNRAAAMGHLTTLYPSVGACVVNEPEFNKDKYDPRRKGNLTSFLFGMSGVQGYVEHRLRDYMRILASQAGFRTRATEPAADRNRSESASSSSRRHYRVDPGSFRGREDVLGRTPVEAVDPFQAAMDDEIIERVAAGDELDQVLAEDLVSDPTSLSAERATRLGISADEVDRRMQRLGDRLRALRKA